MKNIFYSIIFFAGANLLTGCKSNTTTQVVYTGDVIPGTIVGKVYLADTVFMNNYIPISDASGVEINIEGASFSAVTDKDGRYTIANVPPGAYWLIFKKDGFATYHDGVIEFTGNGTDRWDAQVNRISDVIP